MLKYRKVFTLAAIYRPKHVVANVTNKWIYNHLYCCITRKINKPELNEESIYVSFLMNGSKRKDQ